jgi:hypothetical protein
MSDDTTPTRRRVLLGIGTGAAVALAGCSSGDGGGDDTTTAPETDAGMGGDTETDGMGDGTETDGMGNGTETDDGTATPGETAAVRVAHMSPNAPNVDVYVDGSAVLEDVPFGTVSGYLEVPAGERQVEITAAGDPETVVFEGALPVEAGTEYTVAAVGEIGDMADEPFEPLVLTDDNSEVGDDTARVRLVHASPDAPAVDVTLASSGDALYDGLAYGESEYVEAPAGDYTLEVRGDTEGNDGDVVGTFDVSLAGGQVYTAFAAGYLTPDDEPADTAFDLFVVQDTGEMSG